MRYHDTKLCQPYLTACPSKEPSTVPSWVLYSEHSPREHLFPLRMPISWWPNSRLVRVPASEIGRGIGETDPTTEHGFMRVLSYFQRSSDFSCSFRVPFTFSKCSCGLSFIGFHYVSLSDSSISEASKFHKIPIAPTIRETTRFPSDSSGMKTLGPPFRARTKSGPSSHAWPESGH